jgi:acyl-homoserine lactone acylase PvdQ
MDMIDFFIEKIKGNKYEKDGQYKNLIERKEIIKRKGLDDYEEIFYETEDHRLVEINKNDILNTSRNYYLSRQFSLYKNGTLQSYETIFKLMFSKSVKEAQQNFKDNGFDLTCNFLLADRNNNIGYQQYL